MKFFFIFCCFSIISSAQTNDIGVICHHIDAVSSAKNDTIKKINLHTTLNPVKQLLYLPLFVYQRVLSGQVSAICGFDMSCSNFAVNSIKELGVLKGLFLTADRLTRCNGHAQVEAESYLVNHASGKTVDLPAMYTFKK